MNDSVIFSSPVPCVSRGTGHVVSPACPPGYFHTLSMVESVNCKSTKKFTRGLWQIGTLAHVGTKGKRCHTGPLPSSWGNFTGLYYLGLQDNQLSGDNKSMLGIGLSYLALQPICGRSQPPKDCESCNSLACMHMCRHTGPFLEPNDCVDKLQCLKQSYQRCAPQGCLFVGVAPWQAQTRLGRHYGGYGRAMPLSASRGTWPV